MADLKITISSSGGASGASRPVLEMADMYELSMAGIERIRNIELYTKLKISDNPLFIFGETSTVTKYVSGQLMSVFEVVSLTPEKWESFKLTDISNTQFEGREIIWMNFWGDGFIESQIANGNIKPNHWIMAMCKTEEKKVEYRAAAKYVEYWLNAEMDGGIKFPECDIYHRLSHGFKVDPSFTFINNERNCICGYQSKTFRVEPTSKSE